MSHQIVELRISKSSWNQILMYSLSEREINFLCGGLDNKITHIERIRNSSRRARHFVESSDKDYLYGLANIKKLGLKMIAEGHSHPGKNHVIGPSKLDVQEIPKGNIEVICFPRIRKIRAWRISPTLSATLKSEIELHVF